MSLLRTVGQATRTFGLLGALLALAGCGAPAPPPVVRPAPAPAVVGSDGEYRGTATRFQAESRACPRPGLVTIIVFAGKFQYRWDHDTWLNATIDADGTLQANEDGITLRGRLTGPVIEGDITNGNCGFHFTVRKAAG